MEINADLYFLRKALEQAEKRRGFVLCTKPFSRCSDCS